MFLDLHRARKERLSQRLRLPQGPRGRQDTTRLEEEGAQQAKYVGVGGGGGGGGGGSWLVVVVGGGGWWLVVGGGGWWW